MTERILHPFDVVETVHQPFDRVFDDDVVCFSLDYERRTVYPVCLCDWPIADVGQENSRRTAVIPLPSVDRFDLVERSLMVQQSELAGFPGNWDVIGDREVAFRTRSLSTASAALVRKPTPTLRKK